MRNFSRLARFLEQVKFQEIKGQSQSDQELVDIAQGIWDAQINAGDVIPETVSFPLETMEGVQVDWDEDQLKFVINKGTVYLRDDLTDNQITASYDAALTPPLQFHDDEFVVIEGGPYDDEMIILEGVV